jgi:uncharacterized protein involved in exopolysaccharide biosynthesis
MPLQLTTRGRQSTQLMTATYARDLVSVIARQRRIAFIAFLMIFGCAVLFGLFSSDRYESQMEILVDRGELRRAEPVVSGAADDQPVINQQNTITEEELNSEIALLRNQDVLRQVVITCGLDSKPSFVDTIVNHVEALFRHGRGEVVPDDKRIARATERLANKLQIGSLKMSNIIVVTYRSSDPKLAAKVLQTLGDDYLKEHALVHRPPGGFVFFEQETDKAKAELEDAEAKLVSFTQDGGVASGDVQLDDTLRRLSDIQAQQSQTRANIAETQERIYLLESRLKSLPSRQVTLLKTSDNAQLLQQLKSTLLSLQLRRTELLTKYAESYPLVQEVERQITQTQSAITDAEHAQWQEKTTDRDPNYEMVREDLTRSQAELAGLEAGTVSLAREALSDETLVKSLQKQGVTQEDLMRNVKAAEDNYELYLRKSEEARVSEALDKAGFLNVAIAQAATIPILPVHSIWWYIALGWALALFGSAGTAVVVDKFDPTLRTVDEVEWILSTPVIAALPPLANTETKTGIEAERLASFPDIAA